MGILSIFINVVNENVLYYGENGSSRLQKGLNYGINTEKHVFFATFLNTEKSKILILPAIIGSRTY